MHCISRHSCLKNLLREAKRALKSKLHICDVSRSESMRPTGRALFQQNLVGTDTTQNLLYHSFSCTWETCTRNQRTVTKATGDIASLPHSNMQVPTRVIQHSNGVGVECERPARSFAQINSRLFELFGSAYTSAILFQQVRMPAS
jgi:hypothetical protein